MKYTILYWIFCAILGVSVIKAWSCDSVLKRILRFCVWFVGSRFGRYFIFRRVSIEERFEKKETVLVTGASCGIGAQTASILAERGAKVIWTARDVQKAQNVLNDIRWTYYHGERGYVLYLDLACKESIKKFVSEFRKREKKLNCIVLNAAYHGPRRLTADGFEQNLGVNHLGHMYLIYLLMDLLKSSAPSRIVVVVSDLHKMVKGVRFDDLMYERDYTPFGAYNHSKLLNLLFARELARRLKDTNVNVYAAHPGTPIHSELMRESWLGGVLFDQIILPPIIWLFCRSTYEGAQTSVYCSCAKSIAVDTGKYYENSREASVSAAAADDEAAAKLWDVSCKLLEIPNDWL